MENSQIKFYYHSAQSADEVFLPLEMESRIMCAHRGCWEKSSLALVHKDLSSAFPHHTKMARFLKVTTEQQVKNKGS